MKSVNNTTEIIVFDVRTNDIRKICWVDVISAVYFLQNIISGT